MCKTGNSEENWPFGCFLLHAWQLHLKLIVREDVRAFGMYAAMQVRLFPT